jgi:hypothetical protein
MESNTKIQLSTEEAGLINNTEWILTKHQIIKKVYQMLGALNEKMKNELTFFTHLFSDIQITNGKISKGENYRLLPYIILDYPACFSKNNIFAVRTMFWWGNFFSVTLHLSGNFKARFINNPNIFFSLLKEKKFSICINTDEWQHHFEEENYLPAAHFTKEELNIIINRPFLKVAKQLPVYKWKKADEFIMKTFAEIVEMLQLNFQDGKKDLLPVFPITGSDL